MAGIRKSSPENDPVLGLAQQRGRKGVSLEEIADTTKISIRFLRAIETEDFVTLPGGIFSKSYIRQYADAIDYDPDHLLNRYHEITGEPAAEPGETPRRPPASDQGRRSALQWFRAISAHKL